MLHLYAAQEHVLLQYAAIALGLDWVYRTAGLVVEEGDVAARAERYREKIKVRMMMWGMEEGRRGFRLSIGVWRGLMLNRM